MRAAVACGLPGAAFFVTLPLVTLVAVVAAVAGVLGKDGVELLPDLRVVPELEEFFRGAIVW